MALTFIVGSAGSGKSYLLYQKMTTEAAQYENRKKEYVALVPEQYSMEAQREILLSSRRHGSFNTEVVSFSRLAFHVFEELGITNLKVMDDLGKTLILRKVLEDCKKDLVYYYNKASMPGFVEKAKTLLNELKQYNYQIDELDQMIQVAQNQNILKKKLIDMRTITQAFDQYIQEKMITSEDVLHKFCEIIPNSEKIKNTNLFIDSFTGFTPVQYKVLEQLMKYAENVTVAITLPQEEVDFHGYQEQELFYLSKETITKMKELAIRNQVHICEMVVANPGKKPYRIAENPQLCHMEQYIFRNKKSPQYEQPSDSLEVHVTSNPKEEAGWIANEISKLMIAGKYKYKDIAIIVGSMDNYYRYIREELEKSGIPSFIDYKRSVIQNPYIDAIMAAMEVVEKDFSYECLLRFLRLGVVDIDKEEIDLFENYVLQSGKRGYEKYCSKWEKTFKNFDEEKLERVNEVRDKIVLIFSDFRAGMKRKKGTVLDMTKAVYQLLLENQWQRKIANHQEQCRKRNLLDEAKEYEQIYEVIIQLLDKVVEFMGEEKLSIKEYRQILEAGFESQKVGIVPPGLDTVMVGDLERTRLKDIKKIIFFAGVNDGVVPAANVGVGGIITDTEREFLKTENYVMAPTAKESIFTQRFYLYSLFAKPTEKMYFSYSTTGNDGKVMRKSYILSNIERMFPKLLEVRESSKKAVVGDLTNVGEAMTYVTNHLQVDKNLKEDCEAKQVIASLSEDDEQKKILKMMIEGAHYTGRKQKLLPEIARELYGNRNNIGITRLEKYASCAYAQFMNYGLKLFDRKKFEIASYDIGNLYHYSLEMLCRKMQSQNISWRTLTEEELERLVEDCVDKVIDEYENNAISSDARNQYIAKKVRKTTIKTAEILQKHIIAGKFEPTYFEIAVEHGKVDRVDLYENPENNDLYVKVIDYKSGIKKFQISSAFFGTQMQLMIYLGDVIRQEQEKNPGKTVLPAGAFYYEIKDQYVEGLSKKEKEKLKTDEGYTKEELKDKVREAIEYKRYKEYKMSGIFIDQLDVLQEMDRELKMSSDIIPVNIKRDGTYYTDTMAMDDAHFMQLIQHVSKKADSFREEICHGKIDVNPIDSACTYCPYGSACGFDKNGGDKYIEIPRLTLNEVIAKLDEENQQQEQIKTEGQEAETISNQDRKE